MLGLVLCLAGCVNEAEPATSTRDESDAGDTNDRRDAGASGERDAGPDAGGALIDAGPDAGGDAGPDAGGAISEDAGPDAGDESAEDAGSAGGELPAVMAENVVLYVPTGPLATCNRFNASQCEIYSLTFHTSDHTASGTTKVVATPGAFSPSLSPDGTKIAFDRVVGNRLEVNVQELSSGTSLALRQGDKSHWQSDTQLLFGIEDELPDPSDRWTDVGRLVVSTGPLAWDGGTERLVGASPWFGGGASSTDCSAEDPFIHPAASNLMAFHNSPYRAGLGDVHTCPWMLGIRNFDYKNPQPVVVDTNATTWEEGVSFWSFDLSELPSPQPAASSPPPTGCAHLALSPDGSRVLCTDQPTFHSEAHTPPTGAPYNIGFNRLYGFTRENRSGVDRYYSVRGPQPLFDHLHPADIDEIDEIWDQSDGRVCETYYTKRAEFCGGNDAVPANVYCATPPPQAALFARVMWIDFRDRADPVYVDITSLLEDDRGVLRGTLGSFSAACR